ncbi:Cilia- and flagella-associated protein 52 [Bulinus truncatus]|nr:Cilia- and flagella-associated protein 52 [Bulinus truncatus]
MHWQYHGIGKIIVSGWNDGKIRIFGFKAQDLSLDLKHTVMDAHNKGVTAIAMTSTGNCIISGGGEKPGQGMGPNCGHRPQW